MLVKKILIILFFIISILAILFTYRIYQQREINKHLEDDAVQLEKIYEAIELKTQDDFKIIGQMIYRGTGYEPGFNLLMSIAGTKFGTDIVSQYGETRYVGYLDLISQTTSTKVFVGKMLDKENNIVDGKVEIDTKDCGLPSGDTVPFVIKINVSGEKLTGCANVIN